MDTRHSPWGHANHKSKLPPKAISEHGQLLGDFFSGLFGDDQDTPWTQQTPPFLPHTLVASKNNWFMDKSWVLFSIIDSWTNLEFCFLNCFETITTPVDTNAAPSSPKLTPETVVSMYNYEGYVLLIRFFRVICTVQSLFHAYLVPYFYTHTPLSSLILPAKSHKVMTFSKLSMKVIKWGPTTNLFSNNRLPNLSVCATWVC